MVKEAKVAPSKELRYGGELIRRSKDGMISLTDMWKAIDSPANKDAAQWMRLRTTRDLVTVLEQNMGISHVLIKRQGRTGGTWAHPLAAVAYAKYLSPEFHAWANQVVLERIEERSDPELSMSRARDRAVAIWRGQGKSDAWIQNRINTVFVRHRFTDVLKVHGISEGWEYGYCTNGIYRKLLGGSTKEVLLERSLPASANLRDHLDARELAAIALCEASAEEAIEEHDLRGIEQCHSACLVSAEIIATAVAKAREAVADLKRDS